MNQSTHQKIGLNHSAQPPTGQKPLSAAYVRSARPQRASATASRNSETESKHLRGWPLTKEFFTSKTKRIKYNIMC